MSSHAETLRSVLAVLVGALMVVSVALGGIGPTQPAVGGAEAAGVECAVQPFLALGEVLTLGGIQTPDCGGDAPSESDFNTTEANETRASIASSAATLEQTWENNYATTRNLLDQARLRAFTAGEAAAVQAIQNGANLSEAQTAADEAIRDYYTRIQKNLIASWETRVARVNTLKTVASNTTGVDSDIITLGTSESFLGENGGGELFSTFSRIGGTSTTTRTLLNGTAVKVAGIQAVVGGGSPSEFSENLYLWDGKTYVSYNSDYGLVLSMVRVRPTNTTSSHTALNFKEVANLWNSTNSQARNQTANIDSKVSGLYDAEQNGSLNVSDYINPLTLADQYAQQYNETGAAGYAAAAAAANGYAVPNLSRTQLMTISYRGQNYSGLLFSQGAPPSGSWSAGETYQPEFINGSQFFAVQSTNSSLLQLTEPFTITEIVSQSGQDLSSIQPQTYREVTANASDFQEQQNLTREIRVEIERSAPVQPGGGPGGAGGSMGSLQFAGIGLLAGALFVLLYMRQEGEM